MNQPNPKSLDSILAKGVNIFGLFSYLATVRDEFDNEGDLAEWICNKVDKFLPDAQREDEEEGIRNTTARLFKIYRGNSNYEAFNPSLPVNLINTALRHSKIQDFFNNDLGLEEAFLLYQDRAGDIKQLWLQTLVPCTVFPEKDVDIHQARYDNLISSKFKNKFNENFDALYNKTKENLKGKYHQITLDEQLDNNWKQRVLLNQYLADADKAKQDKNEEEKSSSPGNHMPAVIRVIANKKIPEGWESYATLNENFLIINVNNIINFFNNYDPSNSDDPTQNNAKEIFDPFALEVLTAHLRSKEPENESTLYYFTLPVDPLEINQPDGNAVKRKLVWSGFWKKQDSDPENSTPSEFTSCKTNIIRSILNLLGQLSLRGMIELETQQDFDKLKNAEQQKENAEQQKEEFRISNDKYCKIKEIMESIIKGMDSLSKVTSQIKDIQEVIDPYKNCPGSRELDKLANIFLRDLFKTLPGDLNRHYPHNHKDTNCLRTLLGTNKKLLNDIKNSIESFNELKGVTESFFAVWRDENINDKCSNGLFESICLAKAISHYRIPFMWIAKVCEVKKSTLKSFWHYSVVDMANKTSIDSLRLLLGLSILRQELLLTDSRLILRENHVRIKCSASVKDYTNVVLIISSILNGQDDGNYGTLRTGLRLLSKDCEFVFSSTGIEDIPQNKRGSIFITEKRVEIDLKAEIASES